jgi:hypothetical protein
MATYEFRYKLQAAPEARNDGSGMIALDIFGVYRVASTSDPFVEVPGRHKTVLIPANGVVTALASGTNNQKTTAIKNLLAANLFATAPVVSELWTQAGLQAYMDANDLSTAQRAALNTFITVTLAQVYPITFTL